MSSLGSLSIPARFGQQSEQSRLSWTLNSLEAASSTEQIKNILARNPQLVRQTLNALRGGSPVVSDAAFKALMNHADEKALAEARDLMDALWQPLEKSQPAKAELIRTILYMQDGEPRVSI